MPQSTPESREEQLTRHFYDWELWGRGWQLWEQTVRLEPPFHPFFGHALHNPTNRRLDDGRKPTLFSSLFDRKKPLQMVTEEDEEAEPRVPYLDKKTTLAEIQVALPSDTKVSKDASAQFLLGLGHVSRPVSFELVGTNDSIVLQLACAKPDCRQVREQLTAYFPESQSFERNGYLNSLWDTEGARATVAVDFGLSKEFMRPLRCFDRFDPDPLAGLIGAMTDLSREDVALLQVLFVPTINRGRTASCGQ